MSASTPSFFSRLFSSRAPAAAVSIDAHRVTAVAVSGQGTSLGVAGHAVQPLQAGVVTPALNALNVHDQAALVAALRAALDGLSPRPRRAALVLPDAVGKVSLVRFDKVPARAQDLDQLIRWQVRKAAPYRIEDAQVTWAPALALPNGGREFVVTTARRDVIESYEAACAAAGVHAGIVDLATLNLVNAALAIQGRTAQPASTAAPASVAPAASAPADRAQDWLLVHVTPEDGTLAIVRRDALIFFRHRDAASEDDLAEMVHQTAMYHEDRLGGGGFGRVFLAGSSSRGPEAADRLRRHLEAQSGIRVEPLDFRHVVALRDRVTVSHDLLDALGAPLGTILREQVA